MKKSILMFSSLVLSLGLVACQENGENTGSNDSTDSNEEVETGEITINGLGQHYHTGDQIELTAVPSQVVDYDDWHWHTREDSEAEWEEASGQESNTFTSEADTNGLEIKATLYNDDQEIYAESEPATILIDDHHGHDEESRNIYAGIFEDDQVKDRELSDWEGEWQSVYPYLENGDLDEVMEHKAEEGSMTAEEYKDYYTIGYETDLDRITIDNGHVTFFTDGQENSGDYESDGYEILNYEAGNRGVRFSYKLVDGDEAMPEYIQFSDHLIFPTDSSHFHLYWGDDRNELLEEVTKWPTYYPTTYEADDIVRDQLAH